jgi:hypothetical protein
VIGSSTTNLTGLSTVVPPCWLSAVHEHGAWTPFGVGSIKAALHVVKVTPRLEVHQVSGFASGLRPDRLIISVPLLAADAGSYTLWHCVRQGCVHGVTTDEREGDDDGR